MKKVKIFIYLIIISFLCTNIVHAFQYPYRSRAKRIIEQSYSSPVSARKAARLENKYFHPARKVSTGTSKGIIQDLFYWLATRKSFNAAIATGPGVYPFIRYSIIYDKASKILTCKGFFAISPQSSFDIDYNLNDRSLYIRYPSGHWYRPGDPHYEAYKQQVMDHMNRAVDIALNQGGVVETGKTLDFIKGLVILDY